MDMLVGKGADVDYHDPYVEAIKATRRHAGLTGRSSVELKPEMLKGYDAVLIATNHICIDYDHRNSLWTRATPPRTSLKVAIK